MKIVKPNIFVNSSRTHALSMVKEIERFAGICYRGKTLPKIKSLILSGHESTIEHGSISVNITCDRGVSHELVRHRLASYSQESTRYCNYSKDTFGNELTFIEPVFWKKRSHKYNQWVMHMKACEYLYLQMLKEGSTPQEARSILPNSLATKIVVTMNLRSWRHFFALRYFGSTGKPHPQMLEVSSMLYKEFSSLMPEVFFETRTV